MYLDNVQHEYRWKGKTQDTAQFKMNLAEDGKSLQINGNGRFPLRVRIDLGCIHFV